VGFILVSIGDAANVLAALYTDRTYQRDRGHPVLEPTDADVDLSIIRTLLWAPLTLWVMFVPRLLLLAWVIPTVILLFLLSRRWRRATTAHQIFVQRGYALATRQSQGSGRGGVIPSLAPEEIVLYLEQMDGNALRYIQEELTHRQEYRSAEEEYAKQQQQRKSHHRHHRHRTEDSTTDRGAYPRKNKQTGPPRQEISDADLIDRARGAVLDF
jgi:hypothetical protein